LQQLTDVVKSIRNVNEAKDFLASKLDYFDEVEDALTFTIKAHEGQKRKSGEEYVVHPILVAGIVAHFGGTKDMVIAALLHDVVEDTHINKADVQKRYGEEAAHLVDALTKIDEIREHELAASSTDEKLLKSALSFRKMLASSINDPKALIIKLSDRLHNLLTLDALEPRKQKRIAEESLVVYAPIAYKLGISKLKNYIEDLSFKVLFPEEYAKIDDYFVQNSDTIELKLTNICDKIKRLLIENDLEEGSFQVKARIKHYFSIYQKMQRKGVSLEEVLDLLAIRIIVDKPIDCYKALGILHMHYKPLVGRFKDYVAIPKENGYQTIHSTLFHDNAIFEAQIRTFEMESIAEYGMAAHINYKSGVKLPSKWIENLQFSNATAEEFYELVKNDLVSEDIVVYSPKGELFTLPVGATCLDYAYAVHTEVGNKAKEAIVNNVKTPLLHRLSSGDICTIKIDSVAIARCTWMDSVKTSRAKSGIRNLCVNKIKELDKRVAKNILALTFGFDYYELRDWLDNAKYTNLLYRVPREKDFYIETVQKIKTESSLKSKKIFTRIVGLKLRKYHLEHFDFYSPSAVNDVEYDVCCHPKKWDDIVAFYQKGKATIHHKLCSHADELIAKHEPMVYVEWTKDETRTFKVVVSLQNKKGALATLVNFLSSKALNISSISIGKSQGITDYCEVEIEVKNDFKSIKDKINKNFKLIEFTDKNDAYKE
jgi:GTP diphosphokinase / guanosine-3',5'-bis(diphosphate) 3'-diphosphatase